MTQIQTPLVPSILQGPRGITARTTGGAYTQDSQQDIIDGDSLQGGITLLTGTTDAINPHIAGNYIIDTGSADAITLTAPTAEVDDNLSINIWSDTNFAHVVTATALFANGTALKTTATFAAFRGAGMTLRAVDGVWHVIASSGVTFT
jgi:hypothetical protein